MPYCPSVSWMGRTNIWQQRMSKNDCESSVTHYLSSVTQQTWLWLSVKAGLLFFFFTIASCCCCCDTRQGCNCSYWWNRKSFEYEKTVDTYLLQHYIGSLFANSCHYLFVCIVAYAVHFTHDDIDGGGCTHVFVLLQRKRYETILDQRVVVNGHTQSAIELQRVWASSQVYRM